MVGARSWRLSRWRSQSHGAGWGAPWLQAAVMAETPLLQALLAIGLVLAQSHYGSAWLAGAAGPAVALAVAFAPAGASTAGRSAR